MAAVEKSSGLLFEIHHPGSMNDDDRTIFLTTLHYSFQEKGLNTVCVIYDNCGIHIERVARQMAFWAVCELTPWAVCELSTTYLQERLTVANQPFGKKQTARMQITD